MHFSTAVLILASSLALGAHALPQTPPALPLSNSTSCSWGDIATPNAYYVANCQYAAKNSSDGLSYIAQPSFVACLSSCDTNAACNAIAFFPYETGSNLGVGEGYCYNFASYDETANYWTAGSPMIIRGNGAVAKCKNGPYTATTNTTSTLFTQHCNTTPSSPTGPLGLSVQRYFNACIRVCAQTPGCGVADFTHASGECALWEDAEGVSEVGGSGKAVAVLKE